MLWSFPPVSLAIFKNNLPEYEPQYKCKLYSSDKISALQLQISAKCFVSVSVIETNKFFTLVEK